MTRAGKGLGALLRTRCLALLGEPIPPPTQNSDPQCLTPAPAIPSRPRAPVCLHPGSPASWPCSLSAQQHPRLGLPRGHPPSTQPRTTPARPPHPPHHLLIRSAGALSPQVGGAYPLPPRPPKLPTPLSLPGIRRPTSQPPCSHAFVSILRWIFLPRSARSRLLCQILIPVPGDITDLVSPRLWGHSTQKRRPHSQAQHLSPRLVPRPAGLLSPPQCQLHLHWLAQGLFSALLVPGFW